MTLTKPSTKIAIAFVGLCGVLTGAGCYDSSSRYGGETHFLRPCTKTAECSDLGDDYACVVGRCRADMPKHALDSDAKVSMGATGKAGAAGDEPPSASPDMPSTSAGELDASASASPQPISETTPLVVILLDTSGSMERMPGCACVTPSCEECLPDCELGARNRWTQALEALTGTFEDFACEAIERTEQNGMTYDVGYYLPYDRPSGTQRADGALDTYRDRLRFGIATFDGFDTFIGAPPLVPPMTFFASDLSTMFQGMWSYNPEQMTGKPNLHGGYPTGEFFYPSCLEDYFIDTGIRNAIADEGALRIATEPANAAEVNDAIQASLLSVRPYGGTPIASSLDDLYYLLHDDPALEVERVRAAPVHIVLITDGYPDDDYRSFGCDCAATADPADPDSCRDEASPERMHCPYPTAEAAANRLHCGIDLEFCRGPAAAVHVIGYAVDDDAVATELDRIAIAGGDRGAHLASSKLELYRALDEVLRSIETEAR